MTVEIITPDKELFNGEATSLVVPGSEGLLGVLNSHAALISSLTKGVVKLSTDNREQTFDIKGGVVEVLNNKVMILAEQELGKSNLYGKKNVNSSKILLEYFFCKINFKPW
jgi:F-type H+-transporting ATPase subunit epsilon